MNKIVIPSTSIEEKCVNEVLGLTRNRYNELQYEEILEHNVDVCRMGIEDGITSSDYSQMLTEPRIEKGDIVIGFTEGLNQYCNNACLEKEYYGTDYPEEIAKYIDWGYQCCYGDPNRDESEDVSDVGASEESFKRFLEEFVENLGEQVVKLQAEYVKQHPDEFIGNG
ncbi:MAG: hypothetical protein PHP23_11605 [Desulfobacterales bacterium]|nr:hypothetical protein [Desulfobacterales bacterium]MDD4073314.1 hypothetical protein [Desulfobacterales bacterium]MDD4393622.1 hypothetical protein [Desulfobacterales bacterium]